MSTNKHSLPRRGDLVVATIDRIAEYGAYLTVDDYGIKAFLPVSEVSSKWTKKIEEVIRPGQKIVVKVLRLDKLTNTVDVSLKDVAPGERDRVLKHWKKNRRGRKILEEISKEINCEYNRLLTKLGSLTYEYDTLYDMLLDIAVNPNLLNKLNFTDIEKRKILEGLRGRVRPKLYILEIILEITCIGREGVFKIMKTLEKIEKFIQEKGDIKPKIIHIAAPRYGIKLLSYRPDDLKKVKVELKKFISTTKSEVTIDIKEVKERVEV